MAAFFVAHELSLIAVLCLLALNFQSSSSLSPSSSTSLVSSSAAVPCYPADCEALQEVAASFSLASSTVAHNIFHSLHWRPEVDCAFWHGVTCSSGPIINTSTSSTSSNITRTADPKLMYSRVVKLSLLQDAHYGFVDGFNENGTTSIPLALCRLSALVSLDLSNSGLGGSIPSCIGHNLTSLQTLILRSNWFLSGSLSPLANLSLLSHLDLSHNNFTSISSFINCNLPNLQYLDLSYNSLSGSLSPLANYLSLLSHLDLSVNSFTSISSFINCNLPNLQYLDLSYNSLSGSLSPLANLSLLSHLDLSINTFTSISSFIKCNHPHLQYLDLSRNSLSGSISFINITAPLLQHLSLSFNNHQLTAGETHSLEQLLHLEELWMEMAVSASSLGSLFCKLRSLKLLKLNLPNTYVGQEINHNLHGTSDLYDKLLICENPASATSLTDLFLSGQGYTGPFPVWFGDFTRLQSLYLLGNKFEGSIPQEWQALTQLTDLELSGTGRPSIPVFFSQQVQSWLFRLPLTLLTLRSMGLTSHHFPCAGLSLLNHTLQWLDISDNHISPGHSLWHCLHHHNFSHLHYLNLSHNPLALPLQPLLPQFFLTLIDLSFCQLSGSLSNMETLPLAIALLLDHNNLTGSIPSQIGTLGSNIIVLDLSYNKLTGLIPSSLSNMTGLVALVLENNQLHGEFPVISCKWGFINLFLANNHLTKASFRNVSEGIRGSLWQILDLSFNKLQGNIEDLLGDYSVLRNLQVLLLTNNQLTGPIPTSLGTSAPSLIIMDLSNNKLTGALPHSLQLLQALHFQIGVEVLQFGAAILDANNENRTSILSITLESVKNVKFPVHYARGHLDLSFNQLSGSIPEGLGKLIGLHDLNLSRNLLSGPIPPSLANLHYLESLDLSSNKLSGSIPGAFSQLSSLAVFNVSFNPELSGEIPGGPQLENAASYEGDYQLCGEPVRKDCGHEQTPSSLEPSYIQDHEKLGIRKRISLVKEWIEEWTAIPGILLGYILGLGLTIWALKMLHFYK